MHGSLREKISNILIQLVIGRMGMKILEILEKIQREEWVLPPFQRDFVWTDRRKLIDFVDSLYKGYPIGSIIIWNPSEDIHKKRKLQVEASGEPYNAQEFIMDGQQRLTTIARIFNGQPFSFQTYPYILHFDLEEEEFHFIEEDRKVKNCLPFHEIIDGDNQKLVERLDRDLVSKKGEANIGSLFSNIRGIQKRELDIERTNPLPMPEALRLFIRVNTGGKQLTGVNLALGYISVKWEDARKSFEEFRNQMDKTGFNFDLQFFMRCLWAIATKRSLTTRRVRDSKPSDTKNIESDWEKTKEGIRKLIDFLRNELLLQSNKYIDAENTLIPIVLLYSLKPEKVEKQQNLLAYWFCLSYINQRLSGQSTRVLDNDIKTTLESDNPIQELLGDENLEIKGPIKRKMDASFIKGENRHLRLILNILARYNMTRSPISGSRIGSIAVSEDNEPNFDHIFPLSHLDERKFAGKRNDISNLTLMAALPNKRKGGKKPKDFLPEIDEEIRRAHYIPINEELYELNNYTEFLEARRKLVCDAINGLLAKLKTS